MDEEPGFRFKEKEAKEITDKLRQCIELMDESVEYAEANCSEDVVLPFKMSIAQIVADLGWDVLEQGFYKKHPSLRPYD